MFELRSIICKLDSKTTSERMFCFIMPYYFCFRNDLVVLEANEKTQKTKYDGRSFVVGELEILMSSERSVFCICCQGGMGFVFKCVLLWRTVPFFFVF